MPEVIIRIHDETPAPQLGRLRAEVPSKTAQVMSCEVPTKQDPSEMKWHVIDPDNEIDLYIVQCTRDANMAVSAGLPLVRSKSAATVVVAAFPYEQRMEFIKSSLRQIAAKVADILDVDPGAVSITFQKVDLDCWTTGSANV